MNIEILDAPEQALIDFLDKKIADFNWAHWEGLQGFLEGIVQYLEGISGYLEGILEYLEGI